MTMQIQVEVAQSGSSASEGSVRNHKVTMDRPETKGGANLGPMGGEMLLLGLGGCFMSNLLAAVAARDSAVSDIRLSIAGTLDSAPPRFTAIDMDITAEYSDTEEMSKLITIAERGCISANTLRSAVDLNIRLKEPSRS